MLLRPVLFALAIVGAIVTGERERSAWIGLLAFFIASGLARVVRRLLRGRPQAAFRALLWPAFAAGFVVLYHWAGLPTWAAVILAFVTAGVAKNVLAVLLFAQMSVGWRRLDEWGFPGPEDVVEGRSIER
ncbi:MAG TPA: hypothetical protein VFA42_04805 [Gaiellaceae bacterium]|nr:hypothetical protein [Gaiellaceae bacterium]